MNGPDHYAAAEQSLGVAATTSNAATIPVYLAEAQVHATLALAAALALHATTGSSAPLAHPVHELADDEETIKTLNDWHERAVR